MAFRIVSFLIVFATAIWSSVPASADSKMVKISVLIEVPEIIKDLDVFKAIPAAAKIALDSRKKELTKANINIDFDFHQNKMDAAGIHNTMKKVYESDSIAAVGFRSSSGVEYSSKVIQGTDFIAISPFASSENVFDLKPNYYALVAGNKEVANHLEDFIIRDLKSKRTLSIVAWDAPYSRDFQESFSKDFQKNTKLIKTWESLDGFEKEIQGIKDYKPDVVVLPDFPVVSASIIRMIRNAGIDTVFVGADSWGEGDQNTMMKILKNINFEGYTIRQFSSFNLSKEQEHFKNILKNKHNAEYASVVGLYHDSVLHVLNLILNNKKNINRRSIFNSAKNTTLINGIMGKNCLSSRQCTGRTFTILSFNNQGYKIKKVISK